jgi:hypothetical protein
MYNPWEYPKAIIPQNERPDFYYGLLNMKRPGLCNHLHMGPKTVSLGFPPEYDPWADAPQKDPLVVLWYAITEHAEAEVMPDGERFVTPHYGELYFAMATLVQDLVMKKDKIESVLYDRVVTMTAWHYPYLPGHPW